MSGSKRKRVGFAVLGVLVVAGVGVAVFLPDEEPALSIPGRVCGEAVPAAQVKSLLPEHGEGVEDDVFGSSSVNSVSPAWKCTVSAGGQSVQLSEFLVLSEDDYSSKDIARDADKPGNVPLSWGSEKGFIKGSDVSLFIGCENDEGRPVLLETHTVFSGAETDAQERVTALAAEFARSMAARVDHCASVELPDSAPEIG